MKRKICALALTGVLSISLLTTSAFASETSFKDVSGHWAEDAINSVVEKKLFNGTSEDTFSPDASMNRGMFVTVLGRFAESMGYEVSGTPAFSDVSPSAYYAKYVAWGAANGIVNGVSETQFSPNADVTREQMCALFVRFLEFVKYTLPETEDLTFVDSDKISSWAVEPVKAAVSLGLIQGVETADGTVFNPADNATRAQVATVFLRQDALEGIHDLKPAAPQTPADPSTPSQPSTPTPAPSQPSPSAPAPSTPIQQLTEKDLEAEAKVAENLQAVVNEYQNKNSDLNYYLVSCQKVVKDNVALLMNTVSSALRDRENGKLLTKDYVSDAYADQIAEFKSAYKAMDDTQKNQFINAMGRLDSNQLSVIMNYFGFRGI